MNKTYGSGLNTLGVILTLCGIFCMSVVKILLNENVSSLSILVVIVSLIMMVNIRTFTETRFKDVPASIWAIFIYSCASIFFSLFSDISPMTSGQGACYQLVYLAQIVLLVCCFNNVDEGRFIKFFFILMLSIGSICFVLLLHQSLETGELYFNYIVNAKGEDVVSREATASLGYYMFLSALWYKKDSPVIKFLRIVLAGMACFIILCSNRRTIYLAIIANIAFYIYCFNFTKIYDKKKVLKYLIVVLIALLVCFAVYIFDDSIRNGVNYAVESLFNSILTYLGISKTDQSAMYRSRKMDIYPDMFFTKSTVLQLLFGRGYMDIWFDVPFFQAFWDFGLLGGLFYCILQYVVPLPYLFNRKGGPMMKFSQCLVIHSLICSLVNGFPYGVFFPMVLMILCGTSEKKQKLKKQ